MTKKVKFNYAVIKSAFGDYWVGKTKLKADEIYVFSTRAGAVNLAQDLFCEGHPEFNCDVSDEDEEGYDDDLFHQWEDIENDSYDAEEIKKTIEGRIVRR